MKSNEAAKVRCEATVAAAAPELLEALELMVEAYLYDEHARRRGDSEEVIAARQQNAAWKAGLAMGKATRKV